MDKAIHPALGDAYSAIHSQFPYDKNELARYVDLVNEAYLKSINSIDGSTMKLDYDLEILPNYREFSRLNEQPELDFHEPTLPYYWFDHPGYEGAIT